MFRIFCVVGALLPCIILPLVAQAKWTTTNSEDALLDAREGRAKSRYGVMHVVCKNGHLDAYIRFGEVLDSSFMTYRFDKGPVYRESGNLSTDHTAIFIEAPYLFVVMATQSGTLMARSRQYLGGYITRTINLTGSASAIQQAAEYGGCDLSSTGVAAKEFVSGCGNGTRLSVLSLPHNWVCQSPQANNLRGGQSE